MKNYNKIKRINPRKNLVIGFGITDKTISSLKSANGLVVGSLLCKTITNSKLNEEDSIDSSNIQSEESEEDSEIDE